MSKKKENIEPVYFMDLVVENVRCFKDKQVMDLSDGNGKPARWTIILGDNGTGKTTLLKCLAFLMPERHQIPNIKGSKIIFKPIYPIGFRNKYLESSFSNNKNFTYSIGCENFSKGKFYSNNSRNIDGYSYSENEITKTIISDGTSGFSRKNFNIIGYSAKRNLSFGALSESYDNDPLSNLFNKNPKLINAEAWLLEIDFAIKSAKNSTKKYLEKRYNKVRDTLKKLLPDIQDFRIKEITKNNTQAAIEVKTPYGWVDMKNLSLGYQTFIAWVVDLAARLFDRYPDSESPLEEPCIVLVDEIDLHLHPKWQRKIIGFLSDIFKNAQFIVTAHSPLIVQAAEDANIILLKREGDSVKIHNNMDEHAIDDWRFDQILTSELFGLDSARSPRYDAYIERKKAILEKDKLTKKDEKELEAISKKLEEIPLNDKQANDAIEALKKATAILKAS